MKFDSPEWRDERDAKLLQWMKGNTDARDFILQLGEVAEVWDDIVDADHPLTHDRINAAFITALFVLPSNPFLAQHGAHLRPIMFAGVNAWLDSNELQGSQDPWSQTWAYALRDWYAELIPACAFVLGGADHMRAVSREARRFLQAETLKEYLHSEH